MLLVFFKIWSSAVTVWPWPWAVLKVLGLGLEFSGLVLMTCGLMNIIAKMHIIEY